MSETKQRLEPWDELPEKNLKKVRAVTEAMHKATDSMEYNLATDTVKVPGQNWACVSFVSPDGPQKCNQIGMKIRGVFDRQEEAIEHVKHLIKIDPTFDIYVCDMYNWCLVPPDPEKVADQKYQDETLNSIISEYRKNQIYAKEHFEERKREMMEQAAEEARQAALKRIEEESQQEMENAGVVPMDPPSDRFVDISELKLEEQVTGVSASEVMDSML
jgi:hypothetical protein